MTWTIEMIVRLRAMRRERTPVGEICTKLGTPRHEVVEAIDQTIRERDDRLALTRLGEVLNLQRQGVRLINGKPEPLVLRRPDRR